MFDWSWKGFIFCSATTASNNCTDNRSVVTCAELLFAASFFFLTVVVILSLKVFWDSSEGRLAVLIVSHVPSAAWPAQDAADCEVSTTSRCSSHISQKPRVQQIKDLCTQTCSLTLVQRGRLKINAVLFCLCAASTRLITQFLITFLAEPHW